MQTWSFIPAGWELTRVKTTLKRNQSHTTEKLRLKHLLASARKAREVPVLTGSLHHHTWWLGLVSPQSAAVPESSPIPHSAFWKAQLHQMAWKRVHLSICLYFLTHLHNIIFLMLHVSHRVHILCRCFTSPKRSPNTLFFSCATQWENKSPVSALIKHYKTVFQCLIRKRYSCGKMRCN